jgi:hypothetical protein
MGTMPVVLVQPGQQVIAALARGVVEASIGPLPQSGLNKTFGLAVGARGIGASVFMADGVLLTEVAEGQGAVAGAVVGKDALDADTQSLVVGDSRSQESGGGEGLLVRQDQGEGDARVIVDRDMNEVEADAA